jgi:hypothetical protein
MRKVSRINAVTNQNHCNVSFLLCFHVYAKWSRSCTCSTEAKQITGMYDMEGACKWWVCYVGYSPQV